MKVLHDAERLEAGTAGDDVEDQGSHLLVREDLDLMKLSKHERHVNYLGSIGDGPERLSL